MSMGNGNFKARCIHKNNNPYYTEGKIYEVKDRTLIADDGHKIFTGLLWRFEDLQKFSSAEWELVKEYSGEHISIKRRKKRVVAVMTVDGIYKKSANVKLNDFDGDFEKAAKAVVSKLLEKKEDAPLTATSIDWESFKAGKFAVHCDTEEKAREFLKECDEYGIKWAHGQRTIDWNIKDVSNKVYYCHQLILTWGDLERAENVIDYTPSKPAVKEHDQKPYRIVKQDKYEIGDKVKIGANTYNHGFSIGEIVKIGWCGPYDYRASYLDGHDYWYIADDDIEGKVVEDASDKPAVKEVKRPAKAGEWIKLVSNEMFCNGYKKGDVVFVDGIKERPDEKGFIWGVGADIKDDDYVVLENYQPEDKPIDSKPSVKEVSRQGKVGEYIKITKAISSTYNKGDIMNVVALPRDGKGTCGVKCLINGKEECICNSEYVVLEGYQPEQSSIDSNQEVEQQTSLTGMREVKRPAKPGDYVKVVNTRKTHGDYQNGDVLKIIPTSRAGGYFPYYKDKNGCFLYDDEYVVLENYDYSLGHPKNEPFRKAKVGDKIKVVRDIGGHDPEVIIGDVHLVTHMTLSCDGVWTDKRNVFLDKDQEYIIIEEAPEEIQIGDTVNVIKSHRVCNTYGKFIEMYAKDFYSKYSHGYEPKNGDIGVVVGKGKHETYGNDYYAVLSNDKVFCIAKEGIKKVISGEE